MSSDVRVALVYPVEFGDDGHVGGGERYALELGRALARRTPTRLVTFGPRRRSWRIDDLEIEVFPRLWLVRGRFNNPANPLFLASLRDADVIHCLGWHCLPFDLAILYGRATGKRVLVTDVGGGADVSLARLLPLERLVHRFLFLTRHHASLYPTVADRADVIYGGVDTTTFSPGSAPRQLKVLFVGRLIPAKGVEYLIDAVEPSVPLTIVGRPYHRSYHQALLRRARGRNVRFLTDADDGALANEYRTSLVTVLPSVRDSSFGDHAVPSTLGLVLLESMACGTPVICTDVGPEPEIVQDGVTGFVVPPNDSTALARRLEALLTQPELADRMGQAGVADVSQRFTWDKTAERCLAAYRVPDAQPARRASSQPSTIDRSSDAPQQPWGRA